MDKASLLNEKELLLQISEGDEKAFALFFFHYFPQIQPLIAHIIDSQVAATDVIQDIFLKRWLNRVKLTDIQNIHAWVFTLAYHESYSWLRKQKRTAKTVTGIDRTNKDNSTEHYTALRETQRFVQEAIDQRLTKQQQKIYRLSREQHLTIPQMAAQLGLSPNTIKNTLVSALKEIRNYLSENGIYLPALVFFMSFS